MILRVLVYIVIALWPVDGYAQEIWQTAEGQRCIEEWIVDTTTRLNGYNGSAEFNGAKPWAMNQYGHFISRNITQNYEPDAWFSTFRGNKYHYMWGAVYQSELQFPDWRNDDFNSARVEGMRYFARRCVGGGGSSPPPQPINTAAQPLGGYACFGGAVYPDRWRSEASCNAYGCDFGRLSVQACLALGAQKGAEVVHGNTGGARSDECWLQQSCADLRPSADFTHYDLGGSAPPPATPAIDYSSSGGYACFGDAVYPASWQTEASCNAYGCDFGRLSLQACLAVGAEKGAGEVVHGNTGGARSDECWLQQSCGDLRPSADFSLFRR